MWIGSTIWIGSAPTVSSSSSLTEVCPLGSPGCDRSILRRFVRPSGFTAHTLAPSRGISPGLASALSFNWTGAGADRIQLWRRDAASWLALAGLSLQLRFPAVLEEIWTVGQGHRGNALV
jgi:hypothetical protein